MDWSVEEAGPHSSSIPQLLDEKTPAGIWEHSDFCSTSHEAGSPANITQSTESKQTKSQQSLCCGVMDFVRGDLQLSWRLATPPPNPEK